MKKRLLSLLFASILALYVLPLTVLAAGTLSNFQKMHTYAAGQFADVPAAEWYADEVRLAYEFGLVNGTTPDTYSPGQNMTIAEAVKFAACLNEIYNTGVLTLQNGKSLWYQPYIDYALSRGLISPYPDYTAYASRSDMAVIFNKALPGEATLPINNIPDNAIPDVSISQSCGAAVYNLYRAGILSGVDSSHTYNPNSTITRAEVATIVARMADSSIRVPFEIIAGGTGGATSDQQQTTSMAVHAAPSEVSAAKGAAVLVTCTVSSLDFNRIILVIGDPSVASCTWGIPVGKTFPLTIIGLSSGATAVTVRLLDADDSVLAETAVGVTVTGGTAEATTLYFPGYYPVPDFGLYTGTTPYYTEYTAMNSSTFYAYRVSDISGDTEDAVNGYKRLLMQNDFVLYDLNSGPDGDDIFVYVNYAYHLKVYLTNAIRDGIPGIMVKATPF